MKMNPKHIKKVKDSLRFLNEQHVVDENHKFIAYFDKKLGKFLMICSDYPMYTDEDFEMSKQAIRELYSDVPMVFVYLYVAWTSEMKRSSTFKGEKLLIIR